MRLRAKIPLVVGITMFAVFICLLVAARLILDSSTRALEDSDARAAARRMQDAVSADVRQLDRVAMMWAARGDTYRFVENGDLSLMHEDLTNEGLANLGVNFMIFCDETGMPIHSEFLDLDLEVSVEPDERVLSTVSGDERLHMIGDPRAFRRGFLQTPAGVALVAARPITSADLYAPPNGTLVVGRYFDDWETERLAGILQMSVEVVDLADAQAARATAERVSDEGAWWSPVDEDTLVAYASVNEVGGDMLLALRTEQPRTARVQGARFMRYTGVGLALIGVVATIAVFVLVDRGVLGRLAYLSRQVARVRDAGVATMRLEVVGSDELTDLTGEVNEMLEALEGFEREMATMNEQLESRVRERTAELRASEARYRGLLHNMADAVFSVDLDGRITLTNPCGVGMTGLTADELLGTEISRLVGASMASEVERHALTPSDPRIVWTLQVPFGPPGGPNLPAELRGNALVDESGEVIGTQWIARDMTERKKLEQQLIHMASHDHLTGLRNRRSFEQALELELAEIRRQGGKGAIVWLDLDDFKDVNDTLGHRAGDEALVTLSEQLRRQVRESNMLARLGGDEFAILLPGVDEAEAIAAANRVLSEINSYTHIIDGHSVRLSASAGVVTYPEHGSTMEELLANADLAMYQAKDSGRSRVHVHMADDASRKTTASRMAWNERITSALDNDRFVLYAQPVLDVRTGQTARYELLIRLLNDDDEMIMPSEFLPTAERLGLIHEVDRWVARHAIHMLERASDTRIGFDMNLSGKAFSDPLLLPAIRTAIAESRIDPARIGFEITETAAIADIARAQTLIGALKDMGCRFSLDDFGSGFSSFYYLKHLSIDCLKVDGGFIRGLPASAQDQHLVRGMVEMCRGLEIEVAAECVEDAETLECLIDLGVDYAQGFHVGRPEPIESAVRER